MRCAPSGERYAVSRIGPDTALSRSGPGCVSLTSMSVTRRGLVNSSV